MSAASSLHTTGQDHETSCEHYGAVVERHTKARPFSRMRHPGAVLLTERYGGLVSGCYFLSPRRRARVIPGRMVRDVGGVTFLWTLNLCSGIRLSQEFPRSRTSTSDFVPKRLRTLNLSVGVATRGGGSQLEFTSPVACRRGEVSAPIYQQERGECASELFLVSPIFSLEIKLILVRFAISTRILVNFFTSPPSAPHHV